MCPLRVETPGPINAKVWVKYDFLSLTLKDRLVQRLINILLLQKGPKSRSLSIVVSNARISNLKYIWDYSV